MIKEDIINILNSILIEKKEKIKTIPKLTTAVDTIKEDVTNIRNIEDFIYDESIDNIKVLLKGIYDNNLNIELTSDQKESINNYRNKLILLKKEYESINDFEINLLEKTIEDIEKIDINNLKKQDYGVIYLLINNGYIPYDLKEKFLLELI